MAEKLDAVVVGAGPNGLAAAIELARSGYSVKVVEAMGEPGGGTHTKELTLPGFYHDQCSAVHPMGILSPFYRSLPLEDFGLEWLTTEASVAHPLDEGYAVMLYQSLDRTADQLTLADARVWRSIFRPFLKNPHGLLGDLLGPLNRIPKHPITMARFGMLSLWPARRLAMRMFENERARALFSGCAGHSVLSLDHWMTSALGLIFALTAHVETWPVAKGGSRAIGQALSDYFVSLGGEIQCDERVTSLDQLPDSRAVLFDLSPTVFADIAQDALPKGYLKRLRRYHYGPGTYKIDWALDGEIPWRDHRVSTASTVHLGGTSAEIARSEKDAWEGRHNDRPYMILCQQSHADPTRAPEGKHTGYAYCHVPSGSDRDMTDIIEAQVDRFAPGFRDRILARHVTTPADFEQFNPNYVGGAVTGGAAHLPQLFTRPVARFDPYSTPNRKLYMCSASTPPGGGVHGLCGYYAAQSAMRRLKAGKI